MEEWIVKRAELAEMAKMTCSAKEGTIITFIKDWKPLIAFLLKMDKNKL